MALVQMPVKSNTAPLAKMKQSNKNKIQSQNLMLGIFIIIPPKSKAHDTPAYYTLTDNKMKVEGDFL
jgi:hypothetical protein